ncbi:MAG: ParA family protein [Patescibacteria group bacterium]|nr:ParA family protein [Patescibacteria group bacterium]
MQIVAILSQKGGGGKTTFATNLAAAHAAAGHATLLLDMDPQQSALVWDGWRDKEASPTRAPLYVWSAGRGNIVDKITEAKAKRVGLVIIDTPPASDPESELAARSAHLVLVVVQTSAFDLATLEETFSLPALSSRPSIIVLNRVPTSGAEGADARGIIKRLGYEIAPVYLSDRAVFRRAPIDGLGAVEAERASGAGAREVEAVHKWVMSTLAKGPKRVPAAKGGPYAAFQGGDR